MVNKELLEVVQCIICKGDTFENRVKNNALVCSNCKEHFPISDTIPVFLKNEDAVDKTQTEIHRKQASEFNYIDHYQKDAIEFEYFQEREGGTLHSERRVQEYILGNLPKEVGKILDVGCGKAWVAELCCPNGFVVVSLDISLTNVAKARVKYPFENHYAVVADVFNLPFKENSFDFIIASEIIEHVVSPKKLVENLMRVLKPGGTLLITTPYKEKLEYSLCVHCNKSTPRHAHIHSFNEKNLESLFKDKELKLFEYHTFGNKALIHLRTHVLLRFLNFKVWKMIDNLANIFYNSPGTILGVWTKKE